MSIPKVDIIIVNLGTPDDTLECLESIIVNNHQHFDVFIIDIQNKNNSEKKIISWIKEKNDSRFKFIRTKDNKGFAFANNIGIKKSLADDKTDFVWLLNNDTVIKKDTLSQLISCYRETTEKVGFIGSLTLDYYQRNIIQNAGGIFNKWTGYSRLLALGSTYSDIRWKNNLRVDYIVGASMFFHRSLINKIGLMPEDYFLYYEDIDWSISAQKAGFKNITCLKSIVYHKQGITTKNKLTGDTKDLNIKKHLYISYLLLYKRHFKYYLPVAYFILIKQIIGRLTHKKWAEAKLIWKVL